MIDVTGLIIRGAIALIIIGAIVFVVNSVNNAVGEHYIAPVRAEFEKEKKSLQLRAETAETTNRELQAQIAVTKGKIDQCNASVDEIKNTEKSNTEASKALLKAAEERIAQKQSIIAEMKKNASTPTPGEFCEQARKADNTLSDVANRQRVRDAARQALGLSR